MARARIRAKSGAAVVAGALQRADAALLEGRYAEAAEQFRVACMKDASNLEPRLKLARCLLELGQTDGAIACLRVAVRSGAPGALNKSLKVLVSSRRGRFWLKPSDAARALS